MNILIVGGDWNLVDGKPSYFIQEMANWLNFRCAVTCYNGGNYNQLPEILESCVNYDTVIWMANVPNDLPKVRNVKDINKKVMLVTSKRNDEDKYPLSQLITRMLSSKSNLLLEFNKKLTGRYHFRVLDPLGNCWCNTTDFEDCVSLLYERLLYLYGVSRQGVQHNIMLDSICRDYSIFGITDDIQEFVKLIREYGNVFQGLIQPDANTTRYLGNASYRCQKGFPSFRGKNDIIFVSRRNIDKELMSPECFVPVTFSEYGELLYGGQYKPSVDTPIQMRLYNLFPQVNYMLHTHCYINNAPFTNRCIPCGGIEEVEEVWRTLYDFRTDVLLQVNLKGHGSIIMSKDVQGLKDIDYIRREMPEVQYTDSQLIQNYSDNILCCLTELTNKVQEGSIR